MFTLKGNEFSSLINRQFVQNFSVSEASGALDGKFSCNRKNVREENFDILFLSSDFHDDLKVSQLHDTTHVSLHFQIKGTSDADISGLKPGMSMGSGQFNLINCVDPVSTFLFPKQQNYEYICVGLKPDFFNTVLEECGPAYEKVLLESRKGNPFSLFKTSRSIGHLQLSALRLIQNPNLADSLKIPFLRSKVKELILLTLNDYSDGMSPVPHFIKTADQEKLHAVRAYLSQHYLLPHSLDSLSRDFLLNEFKLKNGFKKLFGTTVFKYIQLLRLEHAHLQLTAGGFTVSEIASLIGYESDAAFIRAFKAHYHCSPGKINF